MLFYLPLEHLEERYTELMDEQILKALDNHNVEYKRIYGAELTDKIETGAFLDSEGTNFFKFSQLQQICEEFKNGNVKDGDKFFISDLWFPGIPAIKYMAMFKNIDVDVYGIVHAGSFTDTDFVRKLEDWAQYVEKGWFDSCTKIFLGSEFIRQDLINKDRITDPNKLIVTGLVYDSKTVKKMAGKQDKENIIVMAGRLDDEKQPWFFDELAERLKDTDTKFIKTYEQNLSKKEYFKLLAKSKAIFSAALQENFGYSVLEAVTLGCVPIVPNRLAYKEMYPIDFKYNNMDEAEKIARRALKSPENISQIVEKYDTSIDRMIKEMIK